MIILPIILPSTKSHIAADLGFWGPGERRLFHGTQMPYIDAICGEGFDLRLSGKHGSVYGQGGCIFDRILVITWYKQFSNKVKNILKGYDSNFVVNISIVKSLCK